ncbi:CCE_0567 family metalloprotein [Rhizobium brockwellii]|jgi:hypothetical protein|uniref:CCE_0567 family metalloprotein n=1 Tax=Rhizobium brockwellii TaxID=3019932 RepID=UPI003F97914A
MAELEELKKTVRQLTWRAGIAKIDLHDLTDDLPRGWSEITSFAEKAARAFAALAAAKRELAAAESAKWEARSGISKSLTEKELSEISRL